VSEKKRKGKRKSRENRPLSLQVPLKKKKGGAWKTVDQGGGAVSQQPGSWSIGGGIVRDARGGGQTWCKKKTRSKKGKKTLHRPHNDSGQDSLKKRLARERSLSGGGKTGRRGKKDKSPRRWVGAIQQYRTIFLRKENGERKVKREGGEGGGKTKSRGS